MGGILITGCYGFLGHATAVRLLREGHRVIGIDKERDAISPKGPRIADLAQYKQFEFNDLNLTNYDGVVKLFCDNKPDMVVHFAAQYSVPLRTQTALQFRDANLIGYFNLMEACRISGVPKVLYASSTFVQDNSLPKSMYGATKEFGERCGNVYCHEAGMGFTALRFGSTYGPDCRPDVAAHQLVKKLFARQPIDVTVGGFNYKVAFLYVDDAVETVVRCLSVDWPCLYNVYTVVAEDYLADLNDILTALEEHSGIKADRRGELSPRQGFVIPTEKCERLREFCGYAPSTKLNEGIRQFVEWYKTKRSR
jgi:UDP-glucuronate 4-epimerase